MRTGLVVVGIVFALVGGGLVASLFVLSSGATSTALTTTTFTVAPDSAPVSVFNLSGPSSGTITLTWSSSAAVNVSFSRAGVCAGGTELCPLGPPVASWTAAFSGRWSASGPVPTAYLLSVANRGTQAAGIRATVVESSGDTSPFQSLPSWPLVLLGGGMLLAIGAISVFLGLFLRGGVYAQALPAPPTLRPGLLELDRSGEEEPTGGGSPPSPPRT